eukprot:3111370-Pyramimonas_sp.AAC.1
MAASQLSDVAPTRAGGFVHLALAYVRGYAFPPTTYCWRQVERPAGEPMSVRGLLFREDPSHSVAPGEIDPPPRELSSFYAWQGTRVCPQDCAITPSSCEMESPPL